MVALGIWSGIFSLMLGVMMLVVKTVTAERLGRRRSTVVTLASIRIFEFSPREKI